MKQINNPMTFEQLDEKMDIARADYDKQRYQIYAEYAISRNPYEVGDVFTDHIGSIKIEKIGISIELSKCSSMKYFGVELKKDGTPKKKGAKRWAYQSNEVK
jgi:hypothetical protein